MPQKRRRCSRRPLQEGLSRRRLDEDGASLSESLVDSDSSSRVDGGSPPPGLPDNELVMSSTEPRYHQIIASRLAQLQLPDGADGSDLDGCSRLPSSAILEALLPKSFHDDDLRAALLEYQCQNLLSEIRGPDFMGLDTEDSGDPEPDDLTRDEKYTRAREVLVARMPDIDTYTRLDQEQTHKLYFKHALYRIRAALLLKGKPVDELDDAALERKYPAELIVEKDCFNHYVTDGYFGWDFDSDHLGHKKYLTDYQRLVLLNGDGGDEYTSWKKYRAFYSTPEADRDYLQYWEMIVTKIKWIKKYVLSNESSYEWDKIHSKAGIQAVRIAAEFPHMTMELAAVGFNEYIWNTRTYVTFMKDLDGIFYEIWRRLHVGNQGFTDALKQVYGERLFPAQNRNMKYELEFGDSKLDLLFRMCTEGLTKDVPKSRARELIAQEIRWRCGFAGTYEQYARKKLKIAELLGLIPSDKMV